jgi:CRP-like cAMP-binding protein
MAKPSHDRFVKSCPCGTVLFREGDAGDRMFVIESGRVEVIKLVGDVRFVLATLGPGDSVGEMALLDRRPRFADAVVAEDCRLVVIDASTFDQLVRENGEVAVRIMRKLSERLREANLTIEGFLVQSGAATAVKALRDQAGPTTSERRGFRLLPQSSSPQSLAGLAGLALPEARAVWDRLHEAGLLKSSDGKVQLAPDAAVDDFLAYLELKQKYDPLMVQELAEVTGLGLEEAHGVVRRIFASRLPGTPGGLVDSYQQYLALKRRFEYPDPVPAAPS